MFSASLLVVVFLSCCFESATSVKLGPSWYVFSGAAGIPNKKLDWSSGGKNIANTRNVTDSDVNSKTLKLRSPTFELVVNASTTASPAMTGNAVVVPSWDGSLRAFHKLTKEIFWELDIGMTYYNANITGTKISKATPTLWNRYYLLIGTGYPADLLIISLLDGSLVSKVELDDHPYSVTTGGCTVYNNYAYVPISSTEEIAARDVLNYTCCSFVGSMVSVHLPSGSVNWKTYTVGKNISGVDAFSGAAMWSPNPSISKDLQLVFAATGNNYASPSNYSSCISSMGFPFDYETCNFPEYSYNYPNSVLAFNISNGEIAWSFDARPRKAWHLACNSSDSNGKIGGPNCPPEPRYDYYDFGMAPALDVWCPPTGPSSNEAEPRPTCIPALYIAQKSGILYCINPSNGKVFWANQTAPGGILGGSQWGLAVDDDNVYLGVYNSQHEPWTLVNETVVYGGGWAAHSKSTGFAVWTTANPACFDPSGPPDDPSSNGRSTYSFGAGPPMAINDMVLVTSADTLYFPNLESGIPTYGYGGWVYALNKTDGSIMDDYETGAGTVGSFSGGDKCVCAGSGYRDDHFGMARGTSIFCWCTEPSFIKEGGK